MNILILSFITGIILNFMPCIFPILLLKIYDIIKLSQTENKHNIQVASIGTIIGIIIIFTIFSSIAISFAVFGKTFNLGFHFQNTYFVAITIFFLFLFLLNLLNFFNIEYSNRISQYIQKQYTNSKNLHFGILIQNIITGIFLVLFATPCSIPLIGTITTFAITHNNYLYIFYNYVFIALGMSIPFFILIFYPKSLNFLKNQTKFLLSIRILIIITLILTILWILYIFTLQTNIKSLVILILFLLSIPIILKTNKPSHHKLLAIIFIFTSSITLPISVYQEDEAKKINKYLWKDSITDMEIQKYITQNKTIFINISAKWCLICNFNDITVFSRPKIVNYFKDNNIISIKIDITNNNKDAKRFYEKNIYVPKYIIFNKNYPNGYSFEGQITEKELLDHLNKIFNNNISNKSY